MHQRLVGVPLGFCLGCLEVHGFVWVREVSMVLCGCLEVSMLLFGVPGSGVPGSLHGFVWAPGSLHVFVWVPGSLHGFVWVREVAIAMVLFGCVKSPWFCLGRVKSPWFLFGVPGSLHGFVWDG